METLRYIDMRPTPDRYGTELKFQLTGGGATQHFGHYDTADNVVKSLRELADLIEETVKRRKL